MFNKIRILTFFVLIVGAFVINSCSKKAPVVDTAIDTVKVAVNSEFVSTAELLAYEFTTQTGIGVEFTKGSDSELIEMIHSGSNFDVFISSDMNYPLQLINEKRAIGESYTVYALGIPALYSKTWKLEWTGPEFLLSEKFTKLAVPNPEDNPYGQAGVDIIENIRVNPDVEEKFVLTADEKESLKMVEAKEVDAGFIKFSSISDREKRWAWVVPKTVYPPIEQVAVIIKKDNINKSSEIWMGYLSSDSAKSIIRQSGYGVIDNTAINSSN